MLILITPDQRSVFAPAHVPITRLRYLKNFLVFPGNIES